MDYPLRFEPLLKERVWGGSVLPERYGLAVDEPVGESWEVADHGADVSVVANGPQRGRTLRELFAADPEALVGAARDPHAPDRFPLMLKLLDSRDVLSVQVHPDDDYAAAQPAADLGKTEAWYILEAEPGACIYRGLAEEVSAEAFRRHIETGTVEEILRRVAVRPGEVYYLPAGTVHALGAGLRLAEIQQNSDTTYRLFDWNRTGLDGRPRELHVEDGVRVAELTPPDRDRAEPRVAEQAGCRRQCFIREEKFALERLDAFTGEAPLATGGRSFHILTAVAGPVEVHAGGGAATLQGWDTCLVPAACGAYRITAGPDAAVLLFHVPA
jgi:mannose-6-phosphate isomerase